MIDKCGSWSATENEIVEGREGDGRDLGKYLHLGVNRSEEPWDLSVLEAEEGPVLGAAGHCGVTVWMEKNPLDLLANEV